MKIEVAILKGEASAAQRAAIAQAIETVLNKRVPASREWAKPSLRSALSRPWRGWRP